LHEKIQLKKWGSSAPVRELGVIVTEIVKAGTEACPTLDIFFFWLTADR
jgi:hypothetical protein